MAQLRIVWLSYLGTLGAITFVVLVLSLGDVAAADLSPLQVAAVVALVGLACLAAPRLLTPPADERAAFFLRLAFAEAPALAGFIGFLLTGSAIPFVAGLAFALPAMLQARPD